MKFNQPLIDTHAHLADERLRARLAEILAAARTENVRKIVAIGTTIGDSREVVELAQSHPEVMAAVGIHPNEAARAEPDDWAIIEELANNSRVAAIGETGLDRHWDHTPFSLQQDFFGRHLELAARLGLPVVIHSRESHREVVAQLQGLHRPIRGVAHSFTGTWDQAEELLALGLHISFAGMITFTNKSLDPLRLAAAQIPADRLLVETDSPYLSPAPYRGKTNEPARVVETARKLAELRGIGRDELAEITTTNAEQLFRRCEFDGHPGR